MINKLLTLIIIMIVLFSIVLNLVIQEGNLVFLNNVFKVVMLNWRL